MEMRKKVALVCAVTGGGDSYLKSDKVPRSPEQIAADAVAAAKAGAAIVHLHVRDPETGAFSRKPEYFEEVTRLIKESGTDVVLNMTTGMGGDYEPDDDDPNKQGPTNDNVNVKERMEHVLRCKPEICTIDCGSYNMGNDQVYIAPLKFLRQAGELIKGTGITPEIEAFELGHIWQAKMLMEEGVYPENTLFMLCMGIRYGVEATTDAVVAMKNHLPAGATFGAFGIGRDEYPMLATALGIGAHCRVGLEDNIYLKKGVLASNEDLVNKGRHIIEELGCELMTAEEYRKENNLIKQW